MLEIKRGLLRGKLNTDTIELAGQMNIGRIPPKTQEKEVTPSTEAIEITPDRYYTGLSKVTVNAVTSDIDDNIVAGNIKEGVEILGVTGTYEQGYFPSYEASTLVFADSDRPVTVNESEMILSDN